MSDQGVSTARVTVVGAMLLVAAVVIAGCSNLALGNETSEGPATLIEVEGSDVPQIALTERAEERLGIAMGAVTGAPDALVVPYDAVFYEADGSTWVFTSPDSQTYERTEIMVNSIEDGLALLDSGPPIGTEVVVVGGAELGGVEDGL